MVYLETSTAVSGRYQTGMITTFTGVLILVLLTLMMFFAMRVGVFEQRVSSNEMRQKLAFHAAESGIHHAKEYLRKNLSLVTSDAEDLLSDKTDGWFNPTGGHWRLCSSAPVDVSKGKSGQHPCFADSREYTDSDGNQKMRRLDMFYYVEDLAAADEDVEFPIDRTGLILPNSTETVDVYALLCVLEVHAGDETPVKGCITDLTDENPEDHIITDGSYFMVTLLARGQADCNGSGAECQAQALISEKVSNFGAGAGGNSPAVPLTVKSTYAPSGSVGIVANPNAGGVGVPGSVWMGDDFAWETGSWQTCEMHEYYASVSIPPDIACDQQNGCKCEEREALTYRDSGQGQNLVGGIDMISDPNFPDDLFQFYFGIPRAEYLTVKGWSQVLTSCDPLTALGTDAHGIYWIEGGDGTSCNINASDTVGSPENPVLIITAAESTTFGGGSKIFGTVFATDVEGEAGLNLNGNGALYGALLVESDFSSSNQSSSTFDIVWNETVSRRARDGGGLGKVLGGWSDFHNDWKFPQEES